jgi:hypothetical protein
MTDVTHPLQQVQHCPKKTTRHGKCALACPRDGRGKNKLEILIRWDWAMAGILLGGRGCSGVSKQEGGMHPDGCGSIS